MNREIKFERNVWAEKKMSKLCPDNNIKALANLLKTDDFYSQMETFENMIIILNEAYEKHAHFLDKSHEINVITREELEFLNEEEFMELANRAFADWFEDGKTKIETEPKKANTEPTKSI